MVQHRRHAAQIEAAEKEVALASKAVELAEKVADGLAALAELRALFVDPGDVEMEGCYADGADAAWTAMASAYRARWCANYLSARSYPPGAGFRSASPADHDQEQTAQCHRLREIFGNTFRPVAVDPAWRSAAVVQLAQAIYDEREFDFMPNLADALEEAGCHNDEILSHCRGTLTPNPSPQGRAESKRVPLTPNPSPTGRGGEWPHVRGCWALDLVLKKT
ncbi:MAG: hypothetical protein L0Y72_23850 [Gemmataceae bacterium]|nr:hypothetical protein [Gemmataceae bacterium]MCI0742079.1 hypothetical protein [Gemmataceae bacterium]